MEPTEKYWPQCKSILLRNLADMYAALDLAYAKANQTFVDRLAKVDSKTYKSHLELCRAAIKINYEGALSFREFWEKKMSELDVTYANDLKTIQELPLPSQKEMTQLSLEASILTTVVKPVMDVLSMCGLLCVLLGHKEAIAFEVGAIEQLKGAVVDAYGPDIISVFKRLYRVVTRTLESDQEADKQLQSLEIFRDMMIKWRGIPAGMAKGKSFEEAVKEAFAPWIASD